MVVTGREGQIVSSLIERSPDGVDVVALGRPQLDLAGPPEAITTAIAAERPDLIVSAAAYTQVDKAESEPDMAFAVNEQGVRAVAQAAR
jgi:dTDP-4-dehydrorhamnose reductase